ncbi:DUF3027 domain-containing protein [Spiractinospora alimapuensis]|nr:DUF3027 domain-containing protein [Spiractinospora alimapuensis]
MSPSRRRPAADPACVEAVDLARAAALDIGRPEWVGEHVGAEVEGDRLVTHLFTCLDPAYPGWRFAVTVVRAARAKQVTVNEVALLPGPGARLAPDWLPWKERLRPGDVGVGDLLPAGADDERLMPAYTDVADDQTTELDDQLVWEIGLGRKRVLSEHGREVTADRWYESEAGPHSPLANAAPARCSSCAFFWPLSGEFRQLFGACTNEYAPDDGKVVTLDHGCGAHSEAAAPTPPDEPASPIVDELGYDAVTFDDTGGLELVSSTSGDS